MPRCASSAFSQQPSLREKPLKLRFSLLESVRPRKQNYGDVMSRRQGRLLSSPALAYEASCTIPRNGIRVRPHGHDDHPRRVSCVLEDVNPHSLARIAAPASKYLLNFPSLANPVGFPEVLPWYFSTSRLWPVQ